jgi:hypothetical protein
MSIAGAPVQKVEDMRFGRRAFIDSHLDGAKHSLLVMVEERGVRGGRPRAISGAGFRVLASSAENAVAMRLSAGRRHQGEAIQRVIDVGHCCLTGASVSVLVASSEQGTRPTTARAGSTGMSPISATAVTSAMTRDANGTIRKMRLAQHIGSRRRP